jgi:UPF0716 protein FxsA
LAKWIAIGVLLLPTAEIGAFVLAARFFGLEGAFGLLLATSLLGVAVLWYVGRVVIQRFLRLLAERNAAAIEVASAGLLTVFGGILLVLPGFITDAVGFVLVFPPTRRWIASRMSAAAPRQEPSGVVNLDAGEWRQVPEARLEHQHDEPRR